MTVDALHGMVHRGRVAHLVKELPSAGRVTACTRRPVTRSAGTGVRQCKRCAQVVHAHDRFERPRVIYLLHFLRPFGHAKHYMGSTDDLAAREARHLAGNGARLLAHVRAAGIEWVVARTWIGDRNLERAMKNHGHSRRCPVCAVEGQTEAG